MGPARQLMLITTIEQPAGCFEGLEVPAVTVCEIRSYIERAINPQAMAFNSWDCSSFNNMLRRVLTALNPSSQTVQKHCSHDFRRGCAKDMLAHAGPAAMMAHCGWKDKQSALHYVSQDEMHEQIIANMLSELSDDDN